MRHLVFAAVCWVYLFSASLSATNVFWRAQAPAVDETASSDSALELPLPKVPMTLRDVSERADYIINHFWDAMDFGDTARSRNTAFMEQNFSNFISVFPFASEPAQQTAVGALLHKAEADSAAYVLLAGIAEKYLYEPNSPMLSEDYYILFLDRLVNSPILNSGSARRLRWQLEAANKNRPGMTAADFSYVTRDGSQGTLHGMRHGGDLLLIFYDPDCEHCKETMDRLQHDDRLGQMVADGTLAVLAIYSGDDHDLWVKTASSLPEGWTVGYEPGTMQEDGSYVLRAMPTLYLLDSSKKVLQKDLRLESR